MCKHFILRFGSIKATLTGSQQGMDKLDIGHSHQYPKHFIIGQLFRNISQKTDAHSDHRIYLFFMIGPLNNNKTKKRCWNLVFWHNFAEASSLCFE